MRISKYLIIALSSVLTFCGGGSDTENFSTIYGSTSGLKGELTIQITGGENFTLRNNEKFEFKTSLNAGSEYQIKITEEPCEQRCEISPMNGKVASDKVITLDINCGPKHWDLPTTKEDFVDFSNGFASSYSQSLNKFGDILLSWSQNIQDDSVDNKVFKKEFLNREWKNPKGTDDFIGSTKSGAYPQTCVITDKDISYLLWSQNDENFSRQYLGTKLDNIWVFPGYEDYFSFYGKDASHVTFKVNSKGNGVLVWVQPNSVGDLNVYVAELKDGNWIWPLIEEPINRSYYTTDRISNLEVEINDSGDKVLVWNQFNTYEDDIVMTESHGDKPWSKPVGINSETVSRQATGVNGPSLSMNSVGHAIIAWSEDKDSIGNNSKIYKIENSIDENGNWEWDKFDRNNYISVGSNDNNNQDPSVAINNEGYAIITFQYEVGIFQYENYITKFSPVTGKWSTPARISPRGTDVFGDEFKSNSYSAKVTMDNRNNAAILWSQETSPGTQFYQLFKAESHNVSGDDWEMPALKEQVSFGAAGATVAKISMNNCRAILTWQQQVSDDLKTHLFVAQYH